MFDPHHDDEPTIYSFNRSPHYYLISKAIQNRRHRKASTDSAVKSGLPSPPMDTFKMETPPPTTVSGLTKADICVKLQELRDEKHRLFQLIKQQLVQQEQEQQSHTYFMHSQYWMNEFSNGLREPA